MDIHDEIKLSKGDMLLDSDENKHRNKLPGVKAIDRVSPIKSKSKVTGKSNSPKSRWLPISERFLSPQLVTQYNPITGEVRKESEKAAVVKGNSIVSKSKVAAVVSEKSTFVKSIEKSTVVKESDVMSKVGKSNVLAVVSEKSVVDDNDNLKVAKVSDESNKATVVAPVIEKVLVAMESDKETEPVVVADVKAPVIAAVESIVEKDNPKVTSKVSDESVKVPVVKESVKVPVVKKSVKASILVADKPSSVVADKVDVVKDNINVVADKVVKENVLYVVTDKLKSMFDGTLASFDAKWKSFSNKVNAQFKGNKGGLAFGGIDLMFFPICKSEYFYVAVFSLNKTTAMTILDNSPGTYDSNTKKFVIFLLWASYEVAVTAFKHESHEIQSELHEIQCESHEIQSESHEIQSESHEIQSESNKIHSESHV
nr:ulp1 protease family, C-terminal catalytic domain-containing protein [Tanacetum cinerariifolium]